MTRTEFSLPMNWLLTIAVAVLLTGSAWAIDQDRTIYVFQGGADGEWPEAGLIADNSGNLYGTTMFGGNGCGTVFDLASSDGNRTWTENVLYAFQCASDGGDPQGSLVFDSAGNLYGTTSHYENMGQGAVFELSPPAHQGGAWTENIIYQFSDYNDGFFPVGLIIDEQGNLYGEDPGYPNSHGNVFELSPPAVQGGLWTYDVLYTFRGGVSRDGNLPLGGLVMGKSGNLYGTTWLGGLGSGCNADGCGTVFQMLRPNDKRTTWNERVLYAFTGGADGGEPYGGVTFDKKGNLYGTTGYGGDQIGDGTVFELSPLGGGAWTESVLHAFDRNNEGFRPDTSVVLDKSGNIFGTTSFSDAFELSPPSQQGGSWTETILYNFKHDDPSTPLLSKWDGALYGTLQGDGYSKGEYGMVFKVLLP
jgi:uncharacterized repeat protein (TIGR03803 family)